ncbi:hypothetical protein [Aestuariivirga litoralis]|uniref:hypothetical protein n=1 Tax=Aestuariivirga litoralis TaxID=2650924 RepID=UPI0018C52CE4|nr:hypothetical protein [Aestuariivirga litoralis]MBG1233685.1 hypothetical protein [Aestuariivirga litoralis]
MKKTLIALTAAATLAIGFSATAAKADGLYFGVGAGGQPNFGISINDGYGYGYGHHHGYYNAGWDGDDCGPKIVKVWKWNYNHTFKYKTFKKVWSCY